MRTSYDGKGFDQVPLAFLRCKYTDAAKQKLILLHLPMFTRLLSLLWRRQMRDFHSFIYDGNSFRSDTRIDQALRNILAISNKSRDRSIARMRSPAFSKGKSDPAG